MSKNTKELVSELVKALESDIPEIKIGSNVQVVPTDIDLLDTILGGGIPIGKIVTLVGAPGGGKSTLAVGIVASILKKYKEAIGIYIDVEQGMSVDRLVELGCPQDRTVLISQNITVESVVSTISALFEFKESHNLIDVPFVVVWDSESATLSIKQLEAVDMTKVIGYKARLLSIEIPKLLNRLTEYNITLIVISQLRNKIAMMYQSSIGDLRGLGDMTITGGNIMKFMPYQLLYIRPREELKPELYGFPGAIAELKAVKNRQFVPLIKIPLVLNYLKGYSDLWTKVELLRRAKKFKGTSWKHLPRLTDIKFRLHEIEKLYNENETFKQKFDEVYDDTKQELLAFIKDQSIFNENDETVNLEGGGDEDV